MITPQRIPALPWYRERWPWLLMLGPVVVIVAGFITAWLAFRSADGLVDDDYYKQGLAVNQRIHRDQEAFERRIEVDLELVGPELVARLREESPRDVPPVLLVRFSHPTAAGRDLSRSLVLGPDGVYRTGLGEKLVGRWMVSITDATARWRLVADWQPDLTSALHLVPKKAVAN